MLEAATQRTDSWCQCATIVPIKLDPSEIEERQLNLFPNPDYWQEELLMPVPNIPVVCLECDRSVHLLRHTVHPVLLESVRQDVYQWALKFFAVGLLERKPYQAWAKQQLLDIESPLNAEGQHIRELLDSVRPCYYSIHPRNWDLETCPKCDQPFTVYQSNQHKKQYSLCQTCRLAYEGPPRF